MCRISGSLAIDLRIDDDYKVDRLIQGAACAPKGAGDPVRAEHLRKAYFKRLALKSAQSRRRAKECTDTAEAAEAELARLGGGAA